MLKIAEIRKEKNISQKHLAKLLNIYPSNLSNWENGYTEPNIINLIKIADILEVSTDYLLGRENELGFVEIRKELRPAVSKLASECNTKLNDLGVAIVIGYIARLLEQKEYRL